MKFVSICFAFSLGLSMATQAEDIPWHTNRIVVSFASSGLLTAGAGSFAEDHNFTVLQTTRLWPFIRLVWRDQRDVMTVLNEVIADTRIESAEPDYIRTAHATPNDPLLSQQWGTMIMHATDAWDSEKGNPGIVTAVLDCGVDFSHPDLGQQFWVNADETYGNGIDDDGNGYVDDCNGYDFASGTFFSLPWADDGDPTERIASHGTHVTGIIAAEQDNSQGISGLAPKSKVMVVRVLNSLGTGYSSDIAEGIVYAADNGARVINMSLGGTGLSSMEYEAVKYAWGRGAIVVCSAGNSGDGLNQPEYPSSLPFCISVGATDPSDNIAGFSTHNAFIELAAPGVDILSTTVNGQYKSEGWTGTSMSAPHVSGLTALLFSHYPDLANWQARLLLRAAAIDRGSSGWDTYYGYGRADAATLFSRERAPEGQLVILVPPANASFESTSLVGLLWNPVSGAAHYRVRIVRDGAEIQNEIVTETSFIVQSIRAKKPGNYDVILEALNGSGGTISSAERFFVVRKPSLPDSESVTTANTSTAKKARRTFGNKPSRSGKLRDFFKGKKPAKKTH